MKYKIKYLHESGYLSNLDYKDDKIIFDYKVVDGYIEFESNRRYSVIKIIKIGDKIYHGWLHYYSLNDIKAIYGNLNLETVENIIIKNIIE